MVINQIKLKIEAMCTAHCMACSLTVKMLFQQESSPAGNRKRRTARGIICSCQVEGGSPSSPTPEKGPGTRDWGTLLPIEEGELGPETGVPPTPRKEPGIRDWGTPLPFRKGPGTSDWSNPSPQDWGTPFLQ